MGEGPVYVTSYWDIICVRVEHIKKEPFTLDLGPQSNPTSAAIKHTVLPHVHIGNNRFYYLGSRATRLGY